MVEKKRQVYLDYGATTPVSPEVFSAMEPYFQQKYGNASSIHFVGQEAAEAVGRARGQVAGFFNCQPEEIIFTSGATESNNLALKGVVKKYYARQPGGPRPHIITTKIDHHCVVDSAKALEKEGLAEVTFLSVDKEGMVNPSDLQAAVKKNTILVSVIYVNNEIGVVQPLAQLTGLVKRVDPKIIFHTDAVQAAGYFDLDVTKLGVNLLSLSAHKIYGPKGVGALYIKKGTAVSRMQDGGGHEFGLRSGTLNVPGIVGLGEAVAQVMRNREKDIEHVQILRDKLLAGLSQIEGAAVNGSQKQRSPNNLNMRFANVEGEALLYSLSLAGVAVSTASACASKSLKPSHVLLSLGLPPEQAHSSIRMTLGRYLTDQDINYVIKIFPEIIKKLRQISGDVLQKRLSQKEKRLPDDFGC